MSDEMPEPGVDVPVVDEVLAGALLTQGEAGARALGLLRDAHRILAGAGLERPDEVAESCLRGAADALLSLPGAPVMVGLRSAAGNLLDAVDACSAPTDGTAPALPGPCRLDRPRRRGPSPSPEARRRWPPW
ncbi:hypothetical protein ACFYWY_29430 [Streptomyces sp. NPDC002870]|uniref:hypothetical protein n=1 Tax=Streptomyces sp. NPDC002870 TaxID=3364666 RepID=UPI0036A8C0B5